jgi:hypothetical protein
MSDALGDRLARLDIPVTRGLRERILRGAVPDHHARPPAVPGRGPRARRLTIAAAALALLVAANAVAVYYAPSYGQAIAAAPVVGPVGNLILAHAGLGPSSLAPIDETAVSAGHKVRAVAAYADTLRTVVLVQIDDQPFQVASKGAAPAFVIYGGALALTDQFGHGYSQTAGAETQSVLSFEPLAGPAQHVRGRLTLLITRIMKQVPDPTAPNGLRVVEVSGDWSLRFGVVEGAARSLPLPAQVQLPEATCTFTSIRVSGYFVDLRASVTGPEVQTMRRLGTVARQARAQSSKGGPSTPSPADQRWLDTSDAYFFPRIFTSAGQEVDFVDSGATETTAARDDLQLQVAVPGPGKYLVTCGSAFQRAAQRTITIT